MEIMGLTAQDRCDRCGAQALVKADMKVGELLFCGHHWTEHGDKVAGIAVLVTDTRTAETSLV